jgi:hypothetical protein
LGYDVRTPDGRTRIYNDFLAPNVDAFTSGGGINVYSGSGGSLASKELNISPINSNADASFGWMVQIIPNTNKYRLINSEQFVAKDESGKQIEFTSVKEANDWKSGNSKKTISGDALQVGYEASSLVTKDGFYIGESSSRTKFGAPVQGNTISAKVSRIETIPIYTGTGNKQYGLFVLKPGAPIPADVLEKDPSIKNEKRLFIVAEGGRIAGSNGKETTTGATIYIPATRANLGAVYQGVPTGEKATRDQIKKIIDGQDFFGAKVIGAATKGAERQPKSGFSLLEFDNIA